jgi:transposase-like protein
MTCHNCQIQAVKIGKDRKGNQRFRCQKCRKSFVDAPEKPLGNMYLPLDKAEMCLRLLVEGNSIRSTERVTGVNRNTILDLLVLVGEKCERLLNDKIRGLSVNDVQADEMWGFVGMKEKTKKRKRVMSKIFDVVCPDDSLGDAYTFVAN